MVQHAENSSLRQRGPHRQDRSVPPLGTTQSMTLKSPRQSTCERHGIPRGSASPKTISVSASIVARYGGEKIHIVVGHRASASQLNLRVVPMALPIRSISSEHRLRRVALSERAGQRRWCTDKHHRSRSMLAWRWPCAPPLSPIALTRSIPRWPRRAGCPLRPDERRTCRRDWSNRRRPRRSGAISWKPAAAP